MNWYKITSKAKDRAEILIYEQIGKNFFNEGVSAKNFVTDLNKLDVKYIDLYINSPGGNVFEGNSIYNALVRHKAQINVIIDGVAASIASVIAMAGNKILMPENSQMMIHDPSALVIGTATDMRKMVEALDRIKTGLIAAYKTHATIDEAVIDNLMANETWMTAQEAFDNGFATEVIEPVKMAANFEAFKYFRNVPESLKISGKIKQPQEVEEMDITLELIQNEHPEIVSEIFKGVNADYIRENLPDLVAHFKAEGAQDAAAAEMKRIQDVKAQSLPGHEKLIDELMFDGVTTGEQAAVKILQAEKQSRANIIAGHIEDAPDNIEQPPVDEIKIDDIHLPVEKRCESRWKKDTELQKEFDGDYERYLAAEKAIAAGRVKVLN